MNLVEIKQKLDSLRQRKDAACTAALAFIPKEGDLSEEQRKGYDEAMKPVDGLTADIARLNKMAEHAADAERSVGTQVGGAGAAAPSKTERGIALRPLPLAYGKMHAFADTEEGRRSAYEVGQYLRALLISDENISRQMDSERSLGLIRARDEARSFLKEYAQDAVAASVVRPELRASPMSGQVNSTGGALAPETFQATLIRLVETYGVIDRIVRSEGMVWPMKSDTMRVPRRVGGLTAYYVGDTDQITTSRPTVDLVTLVAKKLAMLTLVPTSLMEDSPIDIAEFVVREMAWMEAKSKDDAGFNGTGAGAYGGIIGLLQQLATNSEYATFTGHSTLATVTAADLLSISARLPQAAEQKARWYGHKSTVVNTFQRLITAIYGVDPKAISAFKATEYLGDPIEKVQIMTKYAAGDTITGKMVLAYGDLSSALVMGDRRELTIRQSTERYFEFDQIAILGTARFDIVPANCGGTRGGAAQDPWMTGGYGG